MPQLTYLDFDLTIRATGTEYSASVVGCRDQSFEAPFNEKELSTFFAGIGQPRTRKAEPPELSTVKAFGEKLFQSVFAGDILTRLRACLDEANSQNKGLRIRLHLKEASESCASAFS